MISNKQLFISAQRALNPLDISNSIVLIVAIITKDKLQIDVFSEIELTSDERDVCYAISGEISGDFPDLDDSKSEVNFFSIDSALQIRPKDNVIVYYRFFRNSN